MRKAAARKIRKHVQVGGSLRQAERRVAEAWHRAESGKRVAPQDTVTFLSWSALASVMTDRRHEMLRHLHRHPEPGIRALARALGRDYKRVHEDVQALTAVGLIDRDGRTLRADYDEIQASITMRGAAA